MDLFLINDYLKSQNYILEVTQDGSPTLRWGAGESMHHSGGAASESVYIYQTALEWLFSEAKHIFNPECHLDERKDPRTLLNDSRQIKKPLTILSLGFGLGYNELLVSLWIVKNKLPLDKISLISFEKDPFLYHEFEKWLEQKNSPMGLVYDLVLNKLIELNQNHQRDESLSYKNIKTNLRRMKEATYWNREPQLSSTKQLPGKFNLFLFDAYSSKTTPELWENRFIDDLLGHYTQCPCVFATYACRGELKRALIKHHFFFFKRKGFKGKRDSTLAIKVEDRISRRDPSFL